jgi:hypothetical protein
MGMSRSLLLVSTAIEITAMLVTAYLVGAGLSVAVTSMNLKQIDLRPALPPPPLLRLPVGAIAVVGLCVLLASCASAWRVRRATETVNVGELLRTSG